MSDQQIDRTLQRFQHKRVRYWSEVEQEEILGWEVTAVTFNKLGNPIYYILKKPYRGDF